MIGLLPVRQVLIVRQLSALRSDAEDGLDRRTVGR